jgi:hypothetical protein
MLLAGGDSYVGIQNRAIDTALGASGDGGTSLGLLIGNLYRAAVMAGGLALLLYMVWGGLNWVTAGGDEKKVEEAKGKITNGIVGMAILVGTAAIASFIGKMFGIDLLNPSM